MKKVNVFFAIMFLTIGGLWINSTALADCRSDSDCCYGYTCVPFSNGSGYGWCRNSSTPPHPSECTSDAQCPGVQICAGGRCVNGGGGHNQCTSDAQCPGLQICAAGRCVNGGDGDHYQCTSDAHCPGQEVCAGGRCVMP